MSDQQFAQPPLSDEQWKLLLHTCRKILGQGEWRVDYYSVSCCYFLLKDALKSGDLVYHKVGILGEEEMMNDSYTRDGGTWGFPVCYQDIIHFIVPKNFTTMQNLFNHDDKKHQMQINDVSKKFDADDVTYERKEFSISVKQNIETLSKELNKLNILHRKTDDLLEIKLY